MKQAFAIAGLMVALSAQIAVGQVQCLVPNKADNSTISFENVCEWDVVVEFEIGNPDFSDHRCFSDQPEGYPCRHGVPAFDSVTIEIPNGDLKGLYRACYADEVGTSVCEFE